MDDSLSFLIGFIFFTKNFVLDMKHDLISTENNHHTVCSVLLKSKSRGWMQVSPYSWLFKYRDFYQEFRLFKYHVDESDL
jgi:hypothetical protein